MGTKLKKQQLKKQWTESGTHFSVSYLQEVQEFLAASKGNQPAQEFGVELEKLPGLRSTFAEQSALKIVMRRLSSMSLAEHSATDEDGSVPDHFLRSCVEGQHQQLAVFSSIQNQVMQHSQNASDFLSQGTFDFADTISSLLAMPRFGSVIRATASPALAGLAHGLQAIVDTPGAQADHISPGLADQAQEAITCMYSLMSRHPASLLEADGRGAVLAASSALQAAIKGAILPRETRAAAAVALSAAVQVPGVPPAVIALQMLSCRQALRAAGQSDDGHMLQEALLLRGLNGDQQKANAMVGAGPPVQQPASWLSLANFAIGSSQQDELMGLMWAHWEDSLPQTVKQVHTAFGLLLDINADCAPQQPGSVPGSHLEGLLQPVALKLLKLRGHRKGKYGPLAGLVPRMGAQALLQLEPDLIEMCMEAMQLDAVCKSASSLLAAMTNSLWDQLHSAHPGDDAKAQAAWEEAWIQPALRLLAAADDRMRTHLSIYALPIPLGKSPASILQLLNCLLHPGNPELATAQVPSVIAVLKTARQQQLMEGLGQLACLHPKSTAFPGMSELSIVSQAISLSMRGEAAGMRSKWLNLLSQLLHRINVASHAALHRQAMRSKASHASLDTAEADAKGLQEQQRFLSWLSRLIIASLYPGAASQRKVTALMILSVIQREWYPDRNDAPGMDSRSNGQGQGATGVSRRTTREKPSTASGEQFEPFCKGFMGPAMVHCLLGCLIDGWTRLRDACVHALLWMPTPLPGYEDPQQMQSLPSELVSGGNPRCWLSELLEWLERAMYLTLPPLARPQEANMGADDVDVLAEEEGDDIDMDGDLGPETQIVTTGCWLTMKEAALVIGKIADHAPQEGIQEATIMTSVQTEHIGSVLLGMLLKMKHNGAVDIAREGLCSVVKRLLKLTDASLCKVPGQWLQRLLAKVQEPGQTRDDIIRRSAGLPPAFMSIFLAEPQGTHKHLLHAGLSGLLTIAGNKESSEPWACVHALNCLRMAFNHSDLALDSSGFFAQGMQTAILGMAAPAWEIRNSASLMYAALIVRMLGFRNVQKGEVPRRAVTAAEFFHRYPPLHGFLLEQLREAATHLQADFTGVHPSLFPILALLARLRPSAAARKADRSEHPLSPEAFVQVVKHCGKARPMAVRAVAAQALAAMAPLDDDCLVDQLLSQLPSAGSPISSQNLVHGTLLQLQHMVAAASQPSLAGRLLQHPACEVRAAAAREMLAQARSGASGQMQHMDLLLLPKVLAESNPKLSGLLRGKSSKSATMSEPAMLPEAWTLSAWRASVRLMEDEDEDAQCAIASAAAAVCDDGTTPHAHVDYVERCSFKFMADEFGNCSVFQRQLLDWIYSPRAFPRTAEENGNHCHSRPDVWTNGAASDTVAFQQQQDSSHAGPANENAMDHTQIESTSTMDRPLPSAPVASSRLFDREPDNRHAEPVLLSQLAAAQIGRLLQQDRQSAGLNQHMQPWLHTLIKDLRQLALRSNESQWESPAAVSMQTSTYRSAEFEQLSRALVGLHEAAGSAPPLRNQAVNGLESAQTLLQTRRPHPILESLLEHAVGVMKGQSERVPLLRVDSLLESL
ncbi:hypothetical protein WJX84_009332 [Apatococcus fuscideae]|uniref:DUF2428 domain-containing protein n=1 Tax=Apatococcus fuscideae TaxID=2026836 RepID=A0AAW1SZW6_9CHLO